MTDGFTGRWLVTEYVHDEDGACIGTVRQTRTLETLANERIRVLQGCDVSPELAQHPMAAFAGDWVFEMSKEGCKRHYHGEDVVGLGLSLTPETIVGAGRWPRFGHDFLSFGALMNPHRQLTGGIFYDGSELQLVARIVGVAVAETKENAGVWAELDKTTKPYMTTLYWKGNWALYGSEGELRHQMDIQRRFEDALTWHDRRPDGTVRTVLLQPRGGNQHVIVSGIYNSSMRPVGSGFWYDYFLRMELDGMSGTRITLYETYDAASQCLLGVGYWRKADADGIPSQVTGYEVYRLFPDNHTP